MRHEQFVRSIIADVAGAALAGCALLGLSLVVPVWVVGVACVVLIPGVCVGLLVWLWLSSRQRDTESFPGADHAHRSPLSLPAPVTNWDWPAFSPAVPAGAGRFSSDRPAPFSSTSEPRQS